MKLKNLSEVVESLITKQHVLDALKEADLCTGL